MHVGLSSTNDNTSNTTTVLPSGGDDVKIDLILKTEFSETVGRQAEFMAGIAADISAAVGCNPEKVQVQVQISLM